MDWFGGTEKTDRNGAAILQVSEVSLIVQEALDDSRLQDIWVQGEVTNYKHHSAGHRYFSLVETSDKNSWSLKCKMWRSSASSLSFDPQNGMKVIAFGSINHYAPYGEYSLIVQEILPAGEGEKHLLVERWKKELAAMGYFAPERKRPLPRFPAIIGIVTSETGAVLQDIKNVIGRRFPLEIIVSPTAVQGEDAHQQIAAAIRRIDGRVDVIIIARGGGSFEDLFPFNHPEVVKAIAACRTPVVSAIGHEVDVTLSDLAADVRAPTPSAAAELCVPDRGALGELQQSLSAQLRHALLQRLERAMGEVLDLRDRLRPRRFERRIHERRQETADLGERLGRALNVRIEHDRLALNQLRAIIDGYNPQTLLARGYCVIEKDKKMVTTVDTLASGDVLNIRFIDGRCDVRVERIRHGRNV